jgi:hypothetical protein
MNRRKFLGFLALAPLALKAVPLFELHPAPETFGDYVQYTNFSDFIVTKSIDPRVLAAASQLAQEAWETDQMLWANIRNCSAQAA